MYWICKGLVRNFELRWARPTALLLTAGLVAGCQSSDGGGSGPSSVIDLSAGALSSFFVADWSGLETAAANLRNSDARYTIQDFIWSFGGVAPFYDSYSLDNANVEYAHAAGLTGVGQTIAIIDNGFLTSHDEFSGKTISMPTGGNAPGVADHGTTVASIAAGSASSGSIIGVAPGANLQLGSFVLGDAAMTAATQQAQAVGAIVQNNSWGYEIDASSANLDAAFGTSAGTNYLNALQSFSNNAVVVFAASNNAELTTSDLMAALPSLIPALEPSWITAVNAVPSVSGGNITSAVLLSSGCMQAAAWCMAADGTVYGAVATGNSDYAIGTGTSFAAPQVSGAVALLAEAFPTLTAQDLRARILASANNSFYSHSGYVQFGTINHGFDATFGHGFLDLKAALSPIGGSYIPLSAGGIAALNGPVILSGGMAGNAISNGLSAHNIVFLDGLGGQFDASAQILSANAIPTQSPIARVADLLTTDLSGQRADPFGTSSQFSSFIAGHELDIAMNDANLTLLLPDPNAAAPNLGFAATRSFDLAAGSLDLGLSVLHEASGVAGIKSLISGQNMASTHGAATFDWHMPVGVGQEFSLSGSVGVALPTATNSAADMSSVRYNSVKLAYGARDIWGAGDRFSIGVSLPQAVQSGSAKFVLPVAMSNGATTFSTVDVGLAPEGRQLDLTISYGLPLTTRSEVLMSAVHRVNAGHIAGESNSGVAIGWKLNF
ncbi:MAG: S8 family serine peptidase [Marinosulfonomonas sp.]|nr:S8 family serine peptidase [Marinosulfonomonas sp.]